MISKKNRRLLQLLGFVIGISFGLWRPQQVQMMLPLLGITVGIGYFFLSRVSMENKTDLTEIKWFVPIQMIMYFVIGGAIGSSVHLYIAFF
ncbi:hypothetical protein ACFP65_01945 [Marinilactibacillus sp. GCM10026970]|uniref:hypothetical protein n=1 Tax=Marinilactibacillus sp. GCM10026970 TaxID=3252642 RepID=UPI00360C236E